MRLVVNPSERVVELTVRVKTSVVGKADRCEEPDGAGVMSDVRVVVITCNEELLGVAGAEGVRDVELELLELNCAIENGHQIDRPANSSREICMIAVCRELSIVGWERRLIYRSEFVVVNCCRNYLT